MFSRLFIGIIAALSVNSALAQDSQLQKVIQRVDGNMYFCQNPGWVDPCFEAKFTNDQCQNFDRGFDNTISSFGPTQGVSCTLFADPNCTGVQLVVKNPGYEDLKQLFIEGQRWDNAASSVSCHTI
ncbi:hypothetical protein C8J56DRAFT_890250 [Mycena floridula]|nr:hypothetical protein C8J56DRAFT_890250 [Mycena floridula]